MSIELPVIIPLDVLIKHGETEIRELAITRAPVAADLYDMPVTGQTLGDFAKVLGRLVSLPPSVIKTLSPPDFRRANQVLMGFLAPGQETGDGA